jgi:hypothetical protein
MLKKVLMMSAAVMLLTACPRGIALHHGSMAAG